MKQKIVVNDKMQTGYTYFLSEKTGENFGNDFMPEEPLKGYGWKPCLTEKERTKKTRYSVT